jgi:cytolysin (calcineurin-like family phosphatase)
MANFIAKLFVAVFAFYQTHNDSGANRQQWDDRHEWNSSALHGSLYERVIGTFNSTNVCSKCGPDPISEPAASPLYRHV